MTSWWSGSNVSIQIEDYNNPGSMRSVSLNSTKTGFFLNMSRVDNERNAQWNRKYTLRINRVCDKAGNCVSWFPREYTYYVYANTVNTITKTINTSDLTSNSPADGTEKNIGIELEDIYGNAIVDAPGIGRKVNFDMSIDNDLRLNQHTNTGSDSAIFIGDTNIPFPIGDTNMTNIPYKSLWDDSYEIDMFVYSPTSLSDPLVPGSAKIHSLKYKITANTSIASGDGSSSPVEDDFYPYANDGDSLRFAPLYTTEFSWEIITQWFLEWGIQNSQLDINGSGATQQSGYFEFGADTQKVEDDIEFLVNSREVVKDTSLWTAFYTDTDFIGSHDFTSQRTDIDLVPSDAKLFLASIVRYIIGGKEVTYPHDIIGKTAYHDIFEDVENTQVSVRIIWNTSSQKTKEIVEWQFEDDLRVFGEREKSIFRRDIAQKIYSVVRGVTPKTQGGRTVMSTNLRAESWDDNGLQAHSLWSDTLLYFGEMWGKTVTLNAATNIQGEKTIFVENGNLFITDNIRNADGDGILGLIVLWWNIYIHPNVTDIHAVLYTDRVVATSLDGENAIDYTTLPASQIANQLYIYGALFSENTLWGSRSTPIECPHYVDCSDRNEAQAYDLNYLRRYFLYDHDGDDGNLTPKIPANGGNSSLWVAPEDKGFPVIIEYDPKLQQTPPPFFDE